MAESPIVSKSASEIAERCFQEHAAVLAASSELISSTSVQAAAIISSALARGRKLLACGNGGSAADAQHFVAELVGRFVTERKALPAIALTTDTSILTSVSNDYGFEHVFARQVRALAQPGDVLVAISTSGISPNVVAAVEAAIQAGCRIISLTGANGGALKARSDVLVNVPSTTTARIQEMHILAIHCICAMVDHEIAQASN